MFVVDLVCGEFYLDNVIKEMFVIVCFWVVWLERHLQRVESASESFICLEQFE